MPFAPASTLPGTHHSTGTSSQAVDFAARLDSAQDASSILRHVAEANERMRSDGRSSVELQVRLRDGQELIIQVRMRGGEFQPVFKTESTGAARCARTKLEPVHKQRRRERHADRSSRCSRFRRTSPPSQNSRQPWKPTVTWGRMSGAIKGGVSLCGFLGKPVFVPSAVGAKHPKLLGEHGGVPIRLGRCRWADRWPGRGDNRPAPNGWKDNATHNARERVHRERYRLPGCLRVPGSLSLPPPFKALLLGFKPALWVLGPAGLGGCCQIVAQVEKIDREEPLVSEDFAAFFLDPLGAVSQCVDLAR